MSSPHQGGTLTITIERGKIKPRASTQWLTKKFHYQAYRAMRIAHAVRKTEAASPRENGPKDEEIRSLGLLGKDKETAATLEKIRQQ